MAAAAAAAPAPKQGGGTPPTAGAAGAAAPPADERLPVTVISGFLGSGKTTLLRHLLEHNDGRRIALIVNDMGEINIDARLLEKAHAAAARESGAGSDALVELTNGCICCTLRDDLVRQLAEFARAGRFDYAIVESTGIGEPMPVAAGFMQSAAPAAQSAKPAAQGAAPAAPLTSLARLDTMVTVVDAANFDQYMSTKATAREAFAKEAAEGDAEADRGVADLLTQQIEFADVVVVNKADQCDDAAMRRIQQTCQRLNPTADVVASRFGRVGLERVLGTRKFNFERATEYPGWVEELDGGHVPETEEYGIASFRWLRRRPLHPQRLHDLLTSERLARERGVVRLKGFVWIHSVVGHYNQALLQCAGRLWRLELESPWMAALPARTLKKELREGGVALTTIRKQHPLWDDVRVGDRSQDVVVIGQAMDRAAVKQALDACLLTDAEWAGKPYKDDPFIVEEEEEGGRSPPARKRKTKAKVSKKKKKVGKKKMSKKKVSKGKKASRKVGKGKAKVKAKRSAAAKPKRRPAARSR